MLLKPDIVRKTVQNLQKLKYGFFKKCLNQVFSLPPYLPARSHLQAQRLNDTTHGHQTLPQLRTHQWDVPFQATMSICPLCLVPSFLFMAMVVFFMQQNHTCVLIFLDRHVCIRCHKIYSKEHQYALKVIRSSIVHYSLVLNAIIRRSIMTMPVYRYQL